ncbi:MAG: PqqD family protein [Gammaproteobacteria bacterium]|nr:PqqD family protein [Gammaproteobacteria bacterium]
MSLYSTYWYRVSDIKPRLRSHVRLYRHIYRGQNWYVVQDPSSSRQHRFNRSAYAIIGLMDGEKTVQEIWSCLSATTNSVANGNSG